MRGVYIGKYIKQRREELELTQEQLCEGICGVTTISRLECGSQTPSRNLINALLQRLGMPSDRYFALLNRNEAEIEVLTEEIRAMLISIQNAVNPQKNLLLKNALQKVAELEQITDEQNKLTRQFILRVKVSLGREDGGYYSADEQLELLLEAIRLTVPRFELNKINDFLYCLDEVIIINQIAGIYELKNRLQTTADILEQLLTYIQTHYQDILESKGHLPMIAHNYGRVLNLLEENEKALEVLETARQACIQYKNYQSLPRIFHVMAVTWHDLGNDEKSKDLYHQAYYLCKAIDDRSNLELLCEDAKEQYGIIFF